VPAVFLSDTGEFRGSHDHRPSDTAAVVDVEFLALVARVTLAATLHLAGSTGSPKAPRSAARYFATRDRTVRRSNPSRRATPSNVPSRS
jgi:hypothetical protein